MATSFPPPLTELPEWQDFAHAAQAAKIGVNSLRILEAAGLKIDVSAQPHSEELDGACKRLLEARSFERARAALFNGEVVNPTEGRAAWHTMLRTPSPVAEVAKERARLLAFVQQADTERRWQSVLHIGIGGSDWGTRLLAAAFGYRRSWRDIRFVSNIDGHAIESGISGLDPHETLVVVVSKSFTTAETLENFRRAVEWLSAAGVPNAYEHVVAITCRPDLAQEMGIPPGNIFPFWEWVGGRFSLWSSVCLATALTVGVDVVGGMLAGAAVMDDHFRTAPISENAPVQMALTGVANRSVRDYSSLNLAVYDSRLFYLVPYLQQLEMESLGKSVDVAGRPVTVPTGPLVWGMPGTDAQHTFFQWLHQGTDGAPVDFIVCQQADHGWADHHQQLLAHCLAQREALLTGKSYEMALSENQDADLEKRQWLAQHKCHPGGRPSNLIVLPRLSPFALGALVALYEHKVFVQALIWGINPFDQWGVEFGKALAHRIRNEWKAGADNSLGTNENRDKSTAYWVAQFAKPTSTN